jgi:ComF family protein
MDQMCNLFARIGRAFRAALLPDKCIACNAFFFYRPATERKNVSSVDKAIDYPSLMAPYLCPECAAEFKPVVSPLCTTCGIMFKALSDGDHRCGDCLSKPKFYRYARASGIYAGSLRGAIQGLKYKDFVRLAEPLGRLLLKTYVDNFAQDPADLIVPVPLHERRLRRRGFNQAHLLLAGWPRALGKLGPGLGPLHLEPDCLIRNQPTRSQTGLGRDERIRNIYNAFVVTDPRLITGKKVLLVDDVFTTGATVNECARVIVEGGAARVDVLTLARAM